MCGGLPSASGGVAKHWRVGGHKEACPQLREEMEERKGGGAGD